MRTIVITGASSGIGREAARLIRKAHPEDELLLVGRNAQRTEQVARELGATALIADFAHLDQVRELAATLRERCERIDVLANNAGGLFDGPKITDDGYELTFQVNHLAPMLLVHELFDVLKASSASIIATASMANLLFGRPSLDDIQGLEKFDQNKAYGNAKLANIIFTQELHRRFHHAGISTCAFHPGVVATNFSAGSGSWMQRFYDSKLANTFGISDEQGGQNLAYFIEGTPGITWTSGTYYNDKKTPGKVHPLARSSKRRAAHFDISSSLLGIHWPA